MNDETKMIGVLVSGGFGAGWSTWGSKLSCLDKDLLAAFERHASKEEILKIAQTNWPEQCTGGLIQCKVEYVQEGTAFRITEYDGYESLEIISDIDYIVAI